MGDGHFYGLGGCGESGRRERYWSSSLEVIIITWNLQSYPYRAHEFVFGIWFMILLSFALSVDIPSSSAKLYCRPGCMLNCDAIPMWYLWYLNF